MTKNDLSELKKRLPRNFVQEIKKRLSANGEKSFSAIYISMVMNGRAYNLSILSVAAEIAKEQDATKKKLTKAIRG